MLGDFGIYISTMILLCMYIYAEDLKCIQRHWAADLWEKRGCVKVELLHPLLEWVFPLKFCSFRINCLRIYFLLRIGYFIGQAA